MCKKLLRNILTVVPVDEKVVDLVLAAHVSKMYASSFTNTGGYWIAIILWCPANRISVARIEVCDDRPIIFVNPQVVCAAVSL